MKRKSGNEVSVLMRRADRLGFVSEAVGILSFVPLGGAAFWLPADIYTFVVWLSCGAVLAVCAWLIHREADKLLCAALMRGKVIPPEVIRLCMKKSPGRISRGKKKMSALQRRGYVRRKRSLPEGVSGKARLSGGMNPDIF